MGICSRQPYRLEWQQKKRGHQQSSHAQVHSTAPSLIIDGWVCQRYSEPREERAACSSLGAESTHMGRAGRQGTSEVRQAVCQPAVFKMTGHDWVVVARRTRVQLVVLPGVLFVSEDRWGLRDWEGGKERAPRPTRPTPVPIGHRFRVLSRPPGRLLCVLYLLPPVGGFHVQGVEGLRRPEPEPGLCLAFALALCPSVSVLSLLLLRVYPSPSLMRAFH